VPKCLVPICGRHLIDYWFDRLVRAGIRRVRVNNHHLPEAVRAHLEVVSAEGSLDVQEAYEPELLGSAGTVAANRDLADGAEDVIVVYADNLSDVDLVELVRFHRSHPDPLTMMLFHTPYPERCGIAELDCEGRVVTFEEKPERPSSDLANAGVYVVSADAYREIADMEVFDFGFDVLPRFVGRMRGWAHPGYHRDIGTHESLEQARRDAPDVFGAGVSP
jgi:mannose-1-phosphate guanylyltransferase